MHECGIPYVQALAAGIRAIAAQEEPIGRQISKMEIADGLLLEKVCPPPQPALPALQCLGWTVGVTRGGVHISLSCRHIRNIRLHAPASRVTVDFGTQVTSLISQAV